MTFFMSFENLRPISVYRVFYPSTVLECFKMLHLEECEIMRL